MERVVNTAITIRCHTRNMPPRDRVLVRRLKEVVGFVKGLGREVAIIENSGYIGHTFILFYLRLARAIPFPSLRAAVHKLNYRPGKSLNNHGRRQSLVASKGSKSANKALRNAITKAKGYADLNALLSSTRAIVPPVLHTATEDTISQPPPKSREETENTLKRGNSYPRVIHDAPLLSTDESRILILADVFETGPRTPTPLTPPLRSGLHSYLTNAARPKYERGLLDYIAT
ncbi:hypothetical protein EDB86DRAFT_3099329 [Lactarius hatsudake]|nr:hypothetical protein EDB86DRAFT_3099329 [Lactarius hatsudake]